MSQRFSYVKYDKASMELQAKFKQKFEEIEELAIDLYPSRPHALLLTALEEAYMWTGKAIRDRQIERLGKVDEQPERNDE